jgi:hypothetical protein
MSTPAGRWTLMRASRTRVWRPTRSRRSVAGNRRQCGSRSMGKLDRICRAGSRARVWDEAVKPTPPLQHSHVSSCSCSLLPAPVPCSCSLLAARSCGGGGADEAAVGCVRSFLRPHVPRTLARQHVRHPGVLSKHQFPWATAARANGCKHASHRV